jgi:glycosyltransferase involved in cell wall biosynthesis
MFKGGIMEIKGIKYIAPFLDGSGYGRASRGNIKALHDIGVPLTLEEVSFDQPKPDLGKEGAFLKSLVGKEIDYNIVVAHMLPHFWESYREPDKKLVGYTVWETSKLPKEWVDSINKADKVLVGCQWNKKLFEYSGVEIPIGMVPHGVDASKFENITPYKISGVNDNTFVFYSIMQWTERKNPIDLLRAYWYAFQNNEDVALVLKAHRNGYSEQEKEAIRNTIKRAKQIMPMEKYPKTLLISDMLSGDEICGLHARGDCYASLDRGEGFGLGPFEAAAAGNAILVTNYGGVTEFALPEHSYLVDFSLEPVHGMPNSPWYRGDQLWARPDMYHASKLMYKAFHERENTKIMGEYLCKFIKTNFNWKAIGEKFSWELSTI